MSELWFSLSFSGIIVDRHTAVWVPHDVYGSYCDIFMHGIKQAMLFADIRCFFNDSSVFPTRFSDSASRSLSLRLDRYWRASQEHDAHILHVPPLADEKPYLPYAGNGYVAVTMDHESPVFIRYGRALSVPVKYHPITMISLDGKGFFDHHFV